MKTLLPDVVYEVTQIMNTIYCKKNIKSNHSHDQHQSSNQIKYVLKAIPLLLSKIIIDFLNKLQIIYTYIIICI